jgi:xanthosine utilization system XapX-like protein
MKDFLLSFVYGFCAVVLVGGIVWSLLNFLGENFVVVAVLLIVVWGVGSSIRDSIKDMKEDR